MAATVDRPPNQSSNLTSFLPESELLRLWLRNQNVPPAPWKTAAVQIVASRSPVKLKVSKGWKYFPLQCALNLTPVRCNLSHEHRSEAGSALWLIFSFLFFEEKSQIKVCKLELEETNEKKIKLKLVVKKNKELNVFYPPRMDFTRLPRSHSCYKPTGFLNVYIFKGCLVQHCSHEPQRDSRQNLFHTPTWQTTFQKKPHSSFTFSGLIEVKYSKSIQPSHFP